MVGLPQTVIWGRAVINQNMIPTATDAATPKGHHATDVMTLAWKRGAVAAARSKITQSDFVDSSETDDRPRS
jgi:hypothetical protein